MLVNHLATRDQELPAGSLVLSGGITEAVAVQAGDSSLRPQAQQWCFFKNQEHQSGDP